MKIVPLAKKISRYIPPGCDVKMDIPGGNYLYHNETWSFVVIVVREKENKIREAVTS